MGMLFPVTTQHDAQHEECRDECSTRMWVEIYGHKATVRSAWLHGASYLRNKSRG